MEQSNSSKRLLFIVYELPPLGGGVGRAAHAILSQITVNKNIHVDVVTSSLTNKHEAIEQQPNLKIYKLPIGNKPPSQYHIQSTSNMIRFTHHSLIKIGQLIKHNTYHHAIYFGYPSALPGFIYSEKVPYSICLRGVDVPGYNHKFGSYYYLYTPLAKLTWSKASHIIANSKWLSDLANKHTHQSINIIPNGIDTNTFTPLPKKQKLKIFTVTAGGTILGPKKRLNDLIAGFAIFHKNHPNSQLILFGTGSEEESLKQLVIDLKLTSSIHFKGLVKPRTLSQILPQCHVFCLPSIAEGMSNAALEALASGLPLILTPTGGSQELLSNQNGISIPFKDPVSIAAAISNLYNNPLQRTNMGNKSRELAKKMTWLSSAQQLLKLINLSQQ